MFPVVMSMKDLELLRGGVAPSVPLDFLTTVCINTFRPEYYFSKEQTVGLAAQVHQRHKDTPEYAEYIKKALPVMLSAHKMLGAVYLFDKGEEIIDILETVRPDHIPYFWLTLLNYHDELGLAKTSLGRRGRSLVWKFLTHIQEKRGLRTIALWFTKNRKAWNEVCYRSHTHFEGDLEHLAASLLFKRQGHFEQIEDESTQTFLRDTANINEKVRTKTLTLKDVKESNLPFLTLEGFASGFMDTKSLEFYDAAFNKMTNYEVLRRTDSMRRNGFLDEYHDRWLQRMDRAAKWIDPTELGSVMLQHPDLSADLRKPLATSLENITIKFPRECVVLCDASRSMKLKRTNPMPRVIWELAGLVAASQGIPAYFIRDRIEKVPSTASPRGIARIFGDAKAYNPTCLSRGLNIAKTHKPKWVILITDGQSNIPYRGHEKLVAKDMKTTTILTLNPTVNPKEPEAATRIGVENEIFLPLRGLRFMGQLLEVVT